MNKRVPALLASLALGVIALTGCSANAGSAAGELSNRVPMAHAAPADTGSTRATAGQVTVTPLSEDDFDHHPQCSRYDSDGVSYCQVLQTQWKDGNAYVGWEAYIGVPQDTVNATMTVAGYNAAVHAASRYVKVEWDSPQIPPLATLDTDVLISLDGGASYRATCNATAEGEGGGYDEEDLALIPA